jgi:YD repeat-containing protein
VATDFKGNITTLPVNLRPAGATTALNLTWDSDNKLRSADIDANGTADVNFQYDALGRRVARTGTGGSVVYVQMEKQTIADYLDEYRCECDEWEPIDSDVCGSN